MEENKSKIKENILQYVEHKELSKRKFYSETGISNGFLDNNSGVTEATIEKILHQYSDINPEWLITGRGSMLKNENLLAKIPAPAPTDVHADTSVKEAHTAVKAPKMGNYASDRLIEEKQRMYEAQITELKAELMNAHMKIGYLTAEKEELQAKLDTSASRADSATDAPVRKEKAS